MWKKILIVSGSIILSFILFIFWYSVTYSMDKVSSKEFNDSSLSDKVLIATQGSTYKNEVVDEVVNQLDQAREEEWNAIVILHTWENWKPELNSAKFVDRSRDRSKLFVISTSGSGDYHLKGVDGITSASDLSSVSNDAEKIVDFVEKHVLQTKPKKLSVSSSELRFKRSWFSSIRR